RSLAPSLLQARRTNEAIGNDRIDLFEIAKAYLPEQNSLPREVLLLTFCTGGDFFAAKGVVEAIIARLNPNATMAAADFSHPMLANGRACELQIDGQRLGFLGEISAKGLKQFELREAATIAEIQID